MTQMKSLFMLLGLFVLPQFAFAVGDAGCGLGSLVFNQNKKVHQILAATTNGTFGSQTFGISTGTSNCRANGWVKVNREEVFFAESNFQNLKVEMAQGQGESLAGFAQVLGCPTAQVQKFGQMTQAQYEALFPTEKTTAVEMLQNLKKQMQSDSTLANHCSKRA